ncbi:helix-turn-helix domain-containing protein [Mycobacterium kubicae]|uniref:helix-turn-helix domain-containing protein n=1 Tax=Mycobacterium kubicae TaxID=120959 RepID=UPI00163EF76B|nr:helix-turn-helix domain-containing protein [Mycobacterium kubicae]QNI06501.1 helix-turn-helix domain-containing protein [Mycobacterium kubicae]
MIEQVSGVLLSLDDARYALDAFDALLVDRYPTARLDQFIGQLRKSVAHASDTAATCRADARKVGEQQDSAHTAPYDLIDTKQAAPILGIKPNGVRDLVRRGKLPAHKAGGRLLLPALSVVELAEKRAAKRGR